MGSDQETIHRAERTFDTAAEFVRLRQYYIGFFNSCATAPGVAKNRCFAGPATYRIAEPLQHGSGNIARL
jgi:hypothetical protein